LIDSDWYFTFDGITLWLIAALVLARSSGNEPGGSKSLFARFYAMKGAFWCAVIGITMIVWAGAESQATQAYAELESGSPGSAAEAASQYESAASLNPLRADYPSKLGLLVDPSTDPSRIERDLRRAAELEPTGVAFRRLATYYLNHGRPSDALAAAAAGLNIEPDFTKLWNLSAQANLATNNLAAAKLDYERAAKIEVSPIGTIRAVTEVVDIDYVDADLYLGDDAMSRKEPTLAATYYRRAEEKLLQYAAEGGTTSQMRMAQIGNRPDSELDTTMRADYVHAATGLVQALTAFQSPDASGVQYRYTQTLPIFDNIIQKSSQLQDSGEKQ
jgi:tetratricopeptide (TPR) repeat protein